MTVVWASIYLTLVLTKLFFVGKLPTKSQLFVSASLNSVSSPLLLLAERRNYQKVKSILESLDLKKKGQVNTIAPAVVALGVAAIVLVLVLVISQELRDTQTAGTEAFTAANDTLQGLATFSDFWVIIVLAIVAAVVIGIIFGVFGRTKR